MNNHEDMISLEVSEDEVFLYLDKTALDILIKDLQGLQQKSDHIHYMSDHWGGVSLSTSLFDKKNKPVHNFKITIM